MFASFLSILLVQYPLENSNSKGVGALYYMLSIIMLFSTTIGRYLYFGYIHKRSLLPTVTQWLSLQHPTKENTHHAMINLQNGFPTADLKIKYADPEFIVQIFMKGLGRDYVSVLNSYIERFCCKETVLSANQMQVALPNQNAPVSTPTRFKTLFKSVNSRQEIEKMLSAWKAICESEKYLPIRRNLEFMNRICESNLLFVLIRLLQRCPASVSANSIEIVVKIYRIIRLQFELYPSYGPHSTSFVTQYFISQSAEYLEKDLTNRQFNPESRKLFTTYICLVFRSLIESETAVKQLTVHPKFNSIRISLLEIVSLNAGTGIRYKSSLIAPCSHILLLLSTISEMNLVELLPVYVHAIVSAVETVLREKVMKTTAGLESRAESTVETDMEPASHGSSTGIVDLRSAVYSNDISNLAEVWLQIICNLAQIQPGIADLEIEHHEGGTVTTSTVQEWIHDLWCELKDISEPIALDKDRILHLLQYLVLRFEGLKGLSDQHDLIAAAESKAEQVYAVALKRFSLGQPLINDDGSMHVQDKHIQHHGPQLLEISSPVQFVSTQPAQEDRVMTLSSLRTVLECSLDQLVEQRLVHIVSIDPETKSLYVSWKGNLSIEPCVPSIIECDFTQDGGVFCAELLSKSQRRLFSGILVDIKFVLKLLNSRLNRLYQAKSAPTNANEIQFIHELLVATQLRLVGQRSNVSLRSEDLCMLLSNLKTLTTRMESVFLFRGLSLLLNRFICLCILHDKFSLGDLIQSESTIVELIKVIFDRPLTIHNESYFNIAFTLIYTLLTRNSRHFVSVLSRFLIRVDVIQAALDEDYPELLVTVCHCLNQVMKLHNRLTNEQENDRTEKQVIRESIQKTVNSVVTSAPLFMQLWNLLLSYREIYLQDLNQAAKATALAKLVFNILKLNPSLLKELAVNVADPQVESPLYSILLFVKEDNIHKLFVRDLTHQLIGIVNVLIVTSQDIWSKSVTYSADINTLLLSQYVNSIQKRLTDLAKVDFYDSQFHLGEPSYLFDLAFSADPHVASAIVDKLVIAIQDHRQLIMNIFLTRHDFVDRLVQCLYDCFEKIPFRRTFWNRLKVLSSVFKPDDWLRPLFTTPRLLDILLTAFAEFGSLIADGNVIPSDIEYGTNVARHVVTLLCQSNESITTYLTSVIDQSGLGSTHSKLFTAPRRGLENESSPLQKLLIGLCYDLTYIHTTFGQLFDWSYLVSSIMNRFKNDLSRHQLNNQCLHAFSSFLLFTLKCSKNVREKIWKQSPEEVKEYLKTLEAYIAQILQKSDVVLDDIHITVNGTVDANPRRHSFMGGRMDQQFNVNRVQTESSRDSVKEPVIGMTDCILLLTSVLIELRQVSHVPQGMYHSDHLIASFLSNTISISSLKPAQRFMASSCLDCMMKHDRNESFPPVLPPIISSFTATAMDSFLSLSLPVPAGGGISIPIHKSDQVNAMTIVPINRTEGRRTSASGLQIPFRFDDNGNNNNNNQLTHESIEKPARSKRAKSAIDSSSRFPTPLGSTADSMGLCGTIYPNSADAFALDMCLYSGKWYWEVDVLQVNGRLLVGLTAAGKKFDSIPDQLDHPDYFFVELAHAKSIPYRIGFGVDFQSKEIIIAHGDRVTTSSSSACLKSSHTAWSPAVFSIGANVVHFNVGSATFQASARDLQTMFEPLVIHHLHTCVGAPTTTSATSTTAISGTGAGKSTQRLATVRKPAINGSRRTSLGRGTGGGNAVVNQNSRKLAAQLYRQNPNLLLQKDLLLFGEHPSLLDLRVKTAPSVQRIGRLAIKQSPTFVLTNINHFIPQTASVNNFAFNIADTYMVGMNQAVTPLSQNEVVQFSVRVVNNPSKAQHGFAVGFISRKTNINTNTHGVTTNQAVHKQVASDYLLWPNVNENYVFQAQSASLISCEVRADGVIDIFLNSNKVCSYIYHPTNESLHPCVYLAVPDMAVEIDLTVRSVSKHPKRHFTTAIARDPIPSKNEILSEPVSTETSTVNAQLLLDSLCSSDQETVNLQQQSAFMEAVKTLAKMYFLKLKRQSLEPDSGEITDSNPSEFLLRQAVIDADTLLDEPAPSSVSELGALEKKTFENLCRAFSVQESVLRQELESTQMVYSVNAQMLERRYAHIKSKLNGFTLSVHLPKLDVDEMLLVENKKCVFTHLRNGRVFFFSLLVSIPKITDESILRQFYIDLLTNSKEFGVFVPHHPTQFIVLQYYSINLEYCNEEYCSIYTGSIIRRFRQIADAQRLYISDRLAIEKRSPGRAQRLSLKASLVQQSRAHFDPNSTGNSNGNEDNNNGENGNTGRRSSLRRSLVRSSIIMRSSRIMQSGNGANGVEEV